MRRLVALLALVVAPGAQAQESPMVTVEITPQEILVGESAQLRVTVLVPTWFSTPPEYPSLELANAITRLPPDSAYPTSQRVGRDTWSGIVRNYRVYPLLGASYRLTDSAIRVSYADPGSEPITVDVDVPDIVFRGVVPEGAESLDPYVAGRNFTLSRETDRSLDDLEAGDALVVRYTAELDGLPAMFIPPLAPDVASPGVSVYADEPVIEDADPARRAETVTLVFDAGGEFSLPGLGIEWWNTADSRIETASVAPLSLAVAGPPAAPAAEEPASTDWRTTAILVIVAGLLVVAYRRVLPRIRARASAARAARLHSEQLAFRQVQAALRDGEPRAAHRHLLTWLDRIAPGCDVREFARRFGGPELEAQASELIAVLYAASSAAPDLDALAEGLARARHNCLRGGTTASATALGPLNP
jgi:hypothetical protein